MAIVELRVGVQFRCKCGWNSVPVPRSLHDQAEREGLSNRAVRDHTKSCAWGGWFYPTSHVRILPPERPLRLPYESPF